MKASEITWKDVKFHPVIELPEKYDVYDFSGSYDPDRKLENLYGVGKFNEIRPDMYKGELYEDQRCIHMGIDIGCPVGTSVLAFYPGEIHSFTDNDRPFDYGPTLITRHVIESVEVFALFGHLSRHSLESFHIGRRFEAGETLAQVGPKTENGGWNPHLHFQLSLEEPEKADMPGVVTPKDRAGALEKFIDPRVVLGPLY